MPIAAGRDEHQGQLGRDDGRGFDLEIVRGTSAEGRGFGLLAMRERVELLGGTFALESAPGQGTTVHARLPLGGGAANAEA